MGRGGNGKRCEIPERGQIIQFPGDARRGRSGHAVRNLVLDPSMGPEDCAYPFGGGSSPFAGESYMTAADAIYLSSVALVAVVIAYVSVRFWWGE
jgi:hypothetical protein